MSVVGVVDYGSGNLHSVVQSLAAVGGQVRIGVRGTDFRDCAGLVLPGVGAFSACMRELNESGAADVVRDWVQAGRPLLGICVGHQVLFERGTEGETCTAGLGLLRGTVEPLAAQRLPHMGWNTVEVAPNSNLLGGLSGERFYFVHSYAVLATPSGVTSWATHEQQRFVAAIEAGPICGTQFHPEKSGAVGAKLLENWLKGNLDG